MLVLPLLLSTLAIGTGSLSELGAQRLKGPPAFASWPPRTVGVCCQVWPFTVHVCAEDLISGDHACTSSLPN